MNAFFSTHNKLFTSSWRKKRGSKQTLIEYSTGLPWQCGCRVTCNSSFLQKKYQQLHRSDCRGMHVRVHSKSCTQTKMASVFDRETLLFFSTFYHFVLCLSVKVFYIFLISMTTMNHQLCCHRCFLCTFWSVTLQKVWWQLQILNKLPNFAKIFYTCLTHLPNKFWSNEHLPHLPFCCWHLPRYSHRNCIFFSLCLQTASNIASTWYDRIITTCKTATHTWKLLSVFWGVWSLLVCNSTSCLLHV